jgi:hypothetical protein
MAITQQLLQSLFDYDSINGGLYWKVRNGKRKTIGKRFGCLEKKSGYRKGTIQSKQYREHRLVWTYHNGDIPLGLEIDHKNAEGLKDDNIIKNLRLATKKQNMQNSKSNVKQYKGVYPHGKNVFYAKCADEYIGSFPTARDAAIAYNVMASVLYGEFAHLNKI